jgi:hypothetical protein
MKIIKQRIIGYKIISFEILIQAMIGGSAPANPPITIF